MRRGGGGVGGGGGHNNKYLARGSAEASGPGGRRVRGSDSRVRSGALLARELTAAVGAQQRRGTSYARGEPKGFMTCGSYRGERWEREGSAQGTWLSNCGVARGGGGEGRRRLWPYDVAKRSSTRSHWRRLRMHSDRRSVLASRQCTKRSSRDVERAAASVRGGGGGEGGGGGGSGGEGIRAHEHTRAISREDRVLSSTWSARSGLSARAVSWSRRRGMREDERCAHLQRDVRRAPALGSSARLLCRGD
jgi:hypothetical protein